jgi:ADP-dependent NAD(P)H-hydrate dehydratase
VNPTGNSGMATGGSGDVLAGMTASILAQGASPFSSATAAVYLHGLAGDIAAEKYGKISMLPTDLINCIPFAYKRCGF